MIVLDENIPASQCERLKRWRTTFRQIGGELGQNGMDDDQIVPLLLRLDRPTFFKLDEDFYNRRLCYERYCLVHLAVSETQVADYVRRILRHAQLNTKAKRAGRVLRASPGGLTGWQPHQVRDRYISWR